MKNETSVHLQAYISASDQKIEEPSSDTLSQLSAKVRGVHDVCLTIQTFESLGRTHLNLIRQYLDELEPSLVPGAA